MEFSTLTALRLNLIKLLLLCEGADLTSVGNRYNENQTEESKNQVIHVLRRYGGGFWTIDAISDARGYSYTKV